MRKKQDQNRRKLNVKKETVRKLQPAALSDDDLARVAGGYTYAYKASCPCGTWH